jgi:hypothetical protein
MLSSHAAFAGHTARGLHYVAAAVMMGTILDITSAQGTWSTANLSAPRSVTGTSVGDVVILAGGVGSDVVDVYNHVTGAWSTAKLSVARSDSAATSVGNVAIFAGGQTTRDVSDAVDVFNYVTGAWSTAKLSVARGNGLAATSVGNVAIFAGGQSPNQVAVEAVDVYNHVTGAWSTAKLSVARAGLAATSVGNVAIFAGGGISGGIVQVSSNAVDIYNNVTGAWSTALLSVARWRLAASSIGALAVFAGGSVSTGVFSNAVDLFNSDTGEWSTSQLSMPPASIAIASAGNLALFAGDAIVDVYHSATKTWSTAQLSKVRCCVAASSVANVALFAGGGSPNPVSVVDIYTYAQPLSTTAFMSTSAAPATTSAAPPPSTSLPFDSSSTLSPSLFPAMIAAGAAVTSGHIPRTLELVQFLSIYCTSLSSRQQTRVSDFQIASFMHIASSKAKYCGVCPGFCSQPQVLLLPTFALISCVFALGVLVVVVDAYKSRSGSVFASPVEHVLLEVSSASSAAAAHAPSSLRLAITAFLARFSRSLIETSSAYVVMPCTFVFVLNVWPSVFARADSSDRAMIVVLPVIMLLFRALVIRQRVVQLTWTDQKLLYVSSAFSCLITVALSVPFASATHAHQSAPLLESDIMPQCIVLALLVLQLIIQTIVRRRATEESSVDITDWPRAPATSNVSSSMFSHHDLVARFVLGPIKRSPAAIACAKFFLLNYVVISQMAMVIAGLSSARDNSAASVEISSDVIGSIPLISSAALLLHKAAKLVKLLWQKCRSRQKQADRRRSSRDRFY